MSLYVEVTNIGWTLDGAPIGLVCSTDSASRSNNKKLHLRVDTQTWSETLEFWRLPVNNIASI